MRDEYVDQNGKPVDQYAKDKKRVRNILIGIGVVLFIVCFYLIFTGIVRSNYCNKIIDTVTKKTLEYAKENNMLPVSEGDDRALDLTTLIEAKKVTEEDVTVNKKVAKGKIKITKYKKEYIVTVELTDCDYCDSSNKKWSKEQTKKPKGKIIDVITYYNYQNKSSNLTDWTTWFTNDKLDSKVSKKYNIRLPKNEDNLPRIAKDAEVVKIEQETKDYYRYRDKRWKYYKGGGNYTDFFSSEQPNGYTNYDLNTLTYTEWSTYSLNYPEKKSYRTIETKTGFKWYKKVKGKKVYYGNGEYFVESMIPDGYQKESESSAPMYRYRDKQWKWYTGEARKYSGYSSTMPRGYTNRDDSLFSYTGYSNWSGTTRITDVNREYREEETDTRYRYRIQYNIYSLSVFPKDVNKDTLEKELKQNIDEILKREDIKLSITYKFKVKK